MLKWTRRSLCDSFSALLGFLASTAAQDPAEGWMAYAVGAMPSSVERSESHAPHPPHSSHALTALAPPLSRWPATLDALLLHIPP